MIKILKIHRSRQGFTAIEIIISIVLLGVLGVFIFSFLGDSLQGYIRVKEHKILYDQARIAMERMIREIRDAEAIASPAEGASGTSINFTRAHTSPQDASTNITFQFTGGQLQRVNNFGTHVLISSGVDTAQSSFARSNDEKDIITIEFLVTGRGSVRFRSQVSPHNM